jgi:hypothetical protein
MKPLRWVGFRNLLWELVDDKLASVAGDELIAKRLSWELMIENLMWGGWIARTKAPATFIHTIGDASIPLAEGGEINPGFWREYQSAAEIGADRESLSGGGPWAQFRYDKDDFAFSLPGNIYGGPARGFAEGVDVQIRTGSLARSPAGRTKGAVYPGDKAISAQAQSLRGSEGLSKRAAARKALLEAGMSDVEANVDRIRKTLR